MGLNAFLLFVIFHLDVFSHTQNIILEVPPNENTNLLIVDGHQGQHSPNNRLKLPSAAGKTVTLNAMINGVNIQTTVQIVSEVYFNANTDLSIEP